MDSFEYYDGDLKRHRIEDLHDNKECLRILNAAIEIKPHYKLENRMYQAYHRAHSYCTPRLKFNSLAW